MANNKMSDLTKLNIAYKKLVGKTNTDNNSGETNEKIGSSIQVDSSTIMASPIPYTPITVVGGVPTVMSPNILKVSFELETILDSQYASGSPGESENTYHAYALKLPSDFAAAGLTGQNIVTASDGTKYLKMPSGKMYPEGAYLASGTTQKDAVNRPEGGVPGQLQIIPTRYGPDYAPVISSSVVGDPFGVFDAQDWFLDTYSGILFLQDPTTAKTPTRVEAWWYVGKLSDQVEERSPGLQGQALFWDQQANDWVPAWVSELANPAATGNTTYGSSTAIPQIEIDKYGRIANITTTSLSAETLGGIVPLSKGGTGANLSLTADGSIYTKSGDHLAPLVETGGNVTVLQWDTSSGGAWQPMNVALGGNVTTNDYTTGLFQDFNNITEVGHAVKLINDVLGGIAPAPAPALSNLEGIPVSGKNNLFIGFTPDYTAFDAAINAASGFPVVANKSQYAKMGGTGGYFKRLGSFASLSSLTAILNNNVAQNPSTGVVNFEAGSFKVEGPTDSATYEVWVNGSLASAPGDYTLTFTNGGTPSTTPVPVAGKFPNGSSFALFYHNSATLSFNSSQLTSLGLNQGYNYIQVKRVVGAFTQATNHIDFVLDSNANTNAWFGSELNGSAITTLSGTTKAYLSGIEYFTGGAFSVTPKLQNFFKGTYQKSGVSFGAVSGFTVPSFVLADYDDGAVDFTDPSALFLQKTCNFNSDTNLKARYLGTAVTATLSATNAFAYTGTVAYSSTNSGGIGTFLFDNNITTYTVGAHTAAELTTESFNSESFRLVATGDFSSTNSLAGFPVDIKTSIPAGYGFDSTKSLISDYTSELLISGGTLRHPSQLLATIPNATVKPPSSIPDYISGSGSGSRYYVRRFKNSGFGGFKKKFDITIPEMVAVQNSSEVDVEVKIPGVTGWRTIKQQAVATPSDLFADGIPCRSAGAGTTTYRLTFWTEGVAEGGAILVRVKATSGWTGSISGITMNFAIVE